MASYDTGYEDELFQHPVGHTLHCGICLNVLKNPVSCRHNEHLFCRACITIHLMNFQTCPSCMEPLTVESLRQAPRTVTNLLSELKIRCQFFDRGCGQFVELGDLERHVTDCGFAPAVCSNEGCKLEVNKQDLLHHETAVCEVRIVKCHNCNEIRQEMDTVKVNLAAMNEKLKGVGEQLARNDRNQENVKTAVGNVVAKVGLVQEQLNKQEESNHQLKADNVEMKRSLNEIMKQLDRMTQQTSHKVQAEEMKKDIAEGGMDREPKVLIAGGSNGGKHINSVEMCSHSNATWTPLQSMKESRTRAYSVVYNNQVFVMGGHDKHAGMKSIEKLSLNAVQVDQSITWENVLPELPAPLFGHCSVVCNGRLIVIGGYDASKRACSDSITEISLAPLYTSKLLATMPQARFLHGVAKFGDKILIHGGKTSSWDCSTNLASVLLYDITKNECKELATLPYPVSEMATVKWGDDSVIMAGGVGSNTQPLSKVLLYNIKTQKSRMLPDMKYKRKGCVAAVVRDTVIVMGGMDERGKCLKSVECFQFDRYSWQELPEMQEARYWATAVVC